MPIANHSDFLYHTVVCPLCPKRVTLALDVDLKSKRSCSIQTILSLGWVAFRAYLICGPCFISSLRDCEIAVRAKVEKRAKLDEMLRAIATSTTQGQEIVVEDRRALA